MGALSVILGPSEVDKVELAGEGSGLGGLLVHLGVSKDARSTCELDSDMDGDSGVVREATRKTVVRMRMRVFLRTMMRRMACERDDTALSFVAAILRFIMPTRNCSSKSSTVRTETS